MFDDLHDSAVEEIRLADWTKGRLELRIRLWKRLRLLIFHEVTSLKLSRLFAWGPSDRINEVRLHESEGGRRQVKFEIQSGDSMEISYRSCEAIDTATD